MEASALASGIPPLLQQIPGVQYRVAHDPALQQFPIGVVLLLALRLPGRGEDAPHPLPVNDPEQHLTDRCEHGGLVVPGRIQALVRRLAERELLDSLALGEGEGGGRPPW